MPHYALSIYQPNVEPPSAEDLAPVMKKMKVLLDDARAQRVWVFNGGLHAPSTASVVRIKGGEVLTTDGPYVEGKEYIGGFMIVDVPDLDAALHWAKRMADALLIPGYPDGLPVEVRPFAHVGPPG
ncbi:MAG: YciI family protein [Myxococcota bacterium]|nr:YciI family protein [Myxococcota bacterium]